MNRRSKKADVYVPFEHEDDSMNQQYIKEKRTKAKKTKQRKQQPRREANVDSDDEVIDIKRGDTVHQHVRPSFLKRWDGESNELDITHGEYDDMSPMFKVYWQCKSKNMRSVIFVQIGTVQFFAFENDAILLHEITKKRLKTFSKFLMVNFWSKEIELVKVDLFERNIAVMMMNEVDDPKYRDENKIMKRQVTEVITPSLYINVQPSSYKQRLLLSIIRNQNNFGVVVLEAEFNKFYIEEIVGEESIHHIRRIINRYRPVEMILHKGADNKVIKEISKQICNPFTLQIQCPMQNVTKALDSFKSLSSSPIFRQLTLLFIKQNLSTQNKFTFFNTINSLQLILKYLQNLNLEAKVFGQGIFEILSFQNAKIKPIYDSQVYQNLQVFRIKNQDDGEAKPGTLIHYLDRCNTNSGKKLLRKWLDDPLREANLIKERQSAIEVLLNMDNRALSLHPKLLAFEKLQKNTVDIYHWVIKNSQYGKLKITNNLKFDKDYNQNKNPAVVKIKQIYRVVQLFGKVEELFKQLRDKLIDSSPLFQSMLKINDITYEKLKNISYQQLFASQGIPSISTLVVGLLNKINYDEKRDHLQPLEGNNPVFDYEKEKIDQLNKKLNDQLQFWRRELKTDKINYISVRARNQIQIPKGTLKDKKYKQLIYSSQTSKFQRYTTTQTNQYSQQLIEHQQLLAKAYEPFMNQIINQFCSYKHIWDIYVRNLAQIDVLMSLAKVAQGMTPRCLPKFVKKGMKIREGAHVGLLQTCQNKVIRNTLKLQDNQKVLLLTGPNMGGKSTLLRQTCLLAIMAQIGSYVPAMQYQCIIFDQIFCRIGASDRIIEGKSTFYVELQQTQRILSQATPSSLVIIDQLGRGTSTYDGMAIAQSTLRYIINQINCYVLFSTHYTPITQSFIDNPQVRCMKIGHLITQHGLEFTYQLQVGVAQKSFANNVAKIVGINQSIIDKAQKKAQEINKYDSLMNDVYMMMVLNKIMANIKSK